MSIAQKYTEKLTTQKYAEKPVITGVELLELSLKTDDGGNFLELFRLKSGQIEGLATPFEVKQISLSILESGAIKAYHIHQTQDDVWFVPPFERLLVNLHDLRQDSNTFDTHLRIVLGGGQAKLLRIPLGVAHGLKNCYQRPMSLIYATNQQFSLDQPDELRLPWDHFGADVWEIQKG